MRRLTFEEIQRIIREELSFNEVVQCDRVITHTEYGEFMELTPDEDPRGIQVSWVGETQDTIHIVIT